MATVIETGEKIVCHCLRVTEMELHTAIVDGRVQTVRCAMAETGAGSGCTACHFSIRQLLEAQSPSSAPTCVTR